MFLQSTMVVVSSARVAFAVVRCLSMLAATNSGTSSVEQQLREACCCCCRCGDCACVRRHWITDQHLQPQGSDTQSLLYRGHVSPLSRRLSYNQVLLQRLAQHLSSIHTVCSQLDTMKAGLAMCVREFDQTVRFRTQAACYGEHSVSCVV